MYNKLNKKAKTCMFISSLIGFLITTLVLIIGYFIGKRYLDSYLANILKITITVIIIIYLISVIFGPPIRYKRYRYCINSDKIDIIEGFIFIERNIVPINRLHKITIYQGPIDRMFKLAKVNVVTAGGDVDIKFLEEEVAEEIANSLKDKVNEICKIDRNVDLINEVKDEK